MRRVPTARRTAFQGHKSSSPTAGEVGRSAAWRANVIKWSSVFDEAYPVAGASAADLERFGATVGQSLSAAEVKGINRGQRNPFPKGDPLYASWRVPISTHPSGCCPASPFRRRTWRSWSGPMVGSSARASGDPNLPGPRPGARGPGHAVGVPPAAVHAGSAAVRIKRGRHLLSV